MTYLFLAFLVIWIGFFLYNAYLLRRLSHLERQMQTFEAYLKSKDSSESRS